MSTVAQIDHAVEVLGKENLILLHTTSTYPATHEELNLKTITTLRQRYGIPVGYSGHESGIVTTAAAVALGACVVERHITMDRAMWGFRPGGFARAIGLDESRAVYPLRGTIPGRRRQARD